MKIKLLLLLVILVGGNISYAQNLKPVNMTDLSIWSNQSSLISYFGSGANAPLGQGYGVGLQFALPQDNRFGAQIVIPTFDNEIFFRRNQAGIWDPWNKVWSTNNLNKEDVDFMCRNLRSNGNLWAKEVIVSVANPWPDYVFQPSYQLMPLHEIKSYVAVHQHLPEVPSAQEIKYKGIDVGAMNTLLMKKVEELTLYLIEKDDEQKNQKLQLESQQRLIIKLSERLNALEKSKI